MFRNFWFMGIQIIIVGGQILILFIGGAAFSIHRLNAAQWAYSLILGAASIPIAIVIRLIPDELILKILPRWPQHLNNNPSLTVEDDEESIQPWNPVFEGIREELAFLKRLRGGRMSNLAYKFQHPIETLLPRSRSESRSRSRSNSDLPRTPDGEPPPAEMTKPSPKSPAKSSRRRHSGSTSTFGPAAAMAGIIAGSVAGGWSPIERRQDEGDSITFSRSKAHSGFDGTSGIEIHPDTREDDPVIVDTPRRSPIPPSQNPDLAPFFEHAPPQHSSSSIRGRLSHSRNSSANP
jgi:P-type Ca2+ transporter type 2C